MKTKDEQLKYEILEIAGANYANNRYEKYDHSRLEIEQSELFDEKMNDFINGAKSEAAKEYHTQIFNEQKLRDEFKMWQYEYQLSGSNPKADRCFDWFIKHIQPTNISDSDKWMDMETAIKDGTEVLVYDEELGVKQCAWLNDAFTRGSKERFCWCVVGSWQDEQGGHFTIDNPIKWQPLPISPLKKL